MPGEESENPVTSEREKKSTLFGAAALGHNDTKRVSQQQICLWGLEYN